MANETLTGEQPQAAVTDGPATAVKNGTPPFVDYYEVLQVSPKADPGTIERVYRYLSQRFHPDNRDGGDKARYDQVNLAFVVLFDREKRAAFDAEYHRRNSERGKLPMAEGVAVDEIRADFVVRQRILWLLYGKRRRNQLQPGLGQIDMERQLDLTRDMLNFHLWYMREKGWVERTEDGYVAVTAAGVEQIEALVRDQPPLLEDQRR